MLTHTLSMKTNVLQLSIWLKDLGLGFSDAMFRLQSLMWNYFCWCFSFFHQNYTLRQRQHDLDDHLPCVRCLKMCGLLHTRTIKDVSGPWKMTMCVIDSDYDTDVDTRRSRAGFVIYLNSEQEPHHIQQYTVTQRGQDLEKKHPDLNLSKTVMDDEPT